VVRNGFVSTGRWSGVFLAHSCVLTLRVEVCLPRARDFLAREGTDLVAMSFLFGRSSGLAPLSLSHVPLTCSSVFGSILKNTRT
jgi:hypothetical protein